MKLATWIYAGLLVLAVGWLAAILAAPKLMCSGYEWRALILYRAFALICHQQRGRSFHWCEWPLAVCVRCTGIYAGALLGLFLYPLWYRLDAVQLPARRYLLLALALLALDWALGLVGVFVHNAASRWVTGLLAGTAAAFYVLPALLAALLPDQHKTNLS
jgi:uncharacterized membrane protein